MIQEHIYIPKVKQQSNYIAVWKSYSRAKWLYLQGRKEDDICRGKMKEELEELEWGTLLKE